MQNPPAFGFGAPAASQTGQAGLFGTATSQGLFQTSTSSTTTPSLFGTANPTAFSAAPNVTAAPNATSAFAATPNTVPAFGATPNATSFGATPRATSSFGTTPAATPSFGVALTATPSFGAAATAAPSFGATPTATPSFGTTQAATPSFGATQAATPSFGATQAATPSFGSTTALPAFGAATTTTPAFSLGSTQPASSFGVTTSSVAPSFGFGNTTSAPGAPNTSISFNLGATLTSTPATTTASLGLGGQPTTQTKVVTTQKDITPKDQPLPNEILQTVEGFKEFVKQQKLHSSDIARCSVRDFRKVEQDINQLAQLLSEVESHLQKNRQLAEKLKYDTAKCLKDVEIAQRTQDTPPGLQYENIAPLKFFLNLADKFERDMQILKVQIEGADNYVKNYRSPNALTPQDLHLGMRRLHESFVALAGRLHSVHSQVESQKEAYLNTRKQLLNDNSNPFEAMYNPTDENFHQMLSRTPPKVATGPTPFSNLAIGLTQPFGSQQNQSSMSYSVPTTSATTGFGNIGFGTAFGSQPPPGASNSLFGNSSLVQNPNTFQLQKPPTGNKRGKQ